MLKYSDLSKGQRKCIDTFVAHDAKFATADTITSKHMYNTWKEIFKKRVAGSADWNIGYPHWLSKNNQIERGLLAFPGPRSVELSKDAVDSLEKSKLQKIINTSKEDTLGISDDEFLAELKANGIEV
jgi:hypothetical protein